MGLKSLTYFYHTIHVSLCLRHEEGCTLIITCQQFTFLYCYPLLRYAHISYSCYNLKCQHRFMEMTNIHQVDNPMKYNLNKNMTADCYQWVYGNMTISKEQVLHFLPAPQYTLIYDHPFLSTQVSSCDLAVCCTYMKVDLLASMSSVLSHIAWGAINGYPCQFMYQVIRMVQ